MDFLLDGKFVMNLVIILIAAWTGGIVNSLLGFLGTPKGESFDLKKLPFFNSG
jgi:hypothetical protein